LRSSFLRESHQKSKRRVKKCIKKFPKRKRNEQRSKYEKRRVRKL
jgi:hypothetical protein